MIKKRSWMKVMTNGRGDEWKWWQNGSGDEWKWWQMEEVTNGSGDGWRWWRMEDADDEWKTPTTNGRCRRRMEDADDEWKTPTTNGRLQRLQPEKTNNYELRKDKDSDDFKDEQNKFNTFSPGRRVRPAKSPGRMRELLRTPMISARHFESSRAVFGTPRAASKRSTKIRTSPEEA